MTLRELKLEGCFINMYIHCEFFSLFYHYMLAKLNYDIVHLYVKTVLILILMLITFEFLNQFNFILIIL